VKNAFTDGLKSLLSSLVNSRQSSAANEIVANRVLDVELRAIFRTGLGNKIIRIKNGYALKEDFIFSDSTDKTFYNKELKRAVKKAGSFMLGFGRGIIVINEAGKDLSTPMIGEPGKYKLDVFSGDMITATGISLDLANERYQRPEHFTIRGFNFHHSRVVEFNYVEPTEFDLPYYKYGGIAEFELIYNQLVNDGIVERASASIIEKNSTLFYKVKGFKAALQSKNESDILNFFSMTEKGRSIFGAGIIDAEDDIKNVDQTLTNLDSVDQITLRRLAMVTGIPLAILVGESVRGMNSTGDVEKQVFNETIETLQQDYYLDPINDLMSKLGKEPISFSESQNITPTEKIEYETKALNNAKLLWEIGEDFSKYLIERGVIEKDLFEEFLEDNLDEDEEIEGITQDLPEDEEQGAAPEPEGELVIDPKASLNGAQVTAMTSLIGQIKTGEISKLTAVRIFAAAFPLTMEQATALLEDVKEKPEAIDPEPEQ
jgi:hypothetical protein